MYAIIPRENFYQLYFNTLAGSAHFDSACTRTDVPIVELARGGVWQSRNVRVEHEMTGAHCCSHHLSEGPNDSAEQTLPP